MGKKTHEKKKGIEEIYVFRFYILDWVFFVNMKKVFQETQFSFEWFCCVPDLKNYNLWIPDKPKNVKQKLVSLFVEYKYCF